MNPPASSLSSPDATPTRQEIRSPELGPALKRDKMLQRVRAARQRLARNPGDSLARVR
jgi:hypothetical protein